MCCICGEEGDQQCVECGDYIARGRGWAIPVAGLLITARVIEPTTEQSVSRNCGPYPPHQLLPREVMQLGRESDGADSWKGRIIAFQKYGGRCGEEGELKSQWCCLAQGLQLNHIHEKYELFACLTCKRCVIVLEVSLYFVCERRKRMYLIIGPTDPGESPSIAWLSS